MIKKVRSDDASFIKCRQGSTIPSGMYRWTRNDTTVTQLDSGIDPDSIDKNTLVITSMSKALVGRYECYLNNERQNTVTNVQIVG